MLPRHFLHLFAGVEIVNASHSSEGQAQASHLPVKREPPLQQRPSANAILPDKKPPPVPHQSEFPQEYSAMGLAWCSTHCCAVYLSIAARSSGKDPVSRPALLTRAGEIINPERNMYVGPVDST
jgi:hypothetical protein